MGGPRLNLGGVFNRWRKQISQLIQRSLDEWYVDDASRLSAALAFYTLLSLSPVVIVVVSLAGFAFGEAAAGGQLAWEIHNIVGWDGATAIQAIIHAAHRQHAGAWALLLSLVALFFGASSAVVELRSDLNTIWGVSPPPSASRFQTILRIGKQRFYSFVLVTGAGVLLLLSVAISASLAALGRALGPRSAGFETRLHVMAFVTSYLVITLLFAAIYRILPDVILEWRDVAVGAAVTGLVFSAGKQLIALYLGKAALASTYGAAGSFVVMLVWVYYSAQLFFLGAEFTKVYTRTCGSHSVARARGVGIETKGPS